MDVFRDRPPKEPGASQSAVLPLVISTEMGNKTRLFLCARVALELIWVMEMGHFSLKPFRPTTNPMRSQPET